MKTQARVEKGISLHRRLCLEVRAACRDTGTALEGGALRVPWADTDRLGRVLFAQLQRGGFSTHLVTGRGWNTRSEFFEAARAAARRGCRIERAFLVPDRHLGADSLLQEHVKLDRRAGIRTRVLDVSEIVARLNRPPSATLTYGLWDGELSCQAVHVNGIGQTEWLLSGSKESIRRCRETTALLKTKARTIPCGVQRLSELAEPLMMSLPVARLLAPVLCRMDRPSGEDCSSSHGLWPCWRLFKIAPTPERSARFFLDAFGSLAREGSFRRVLVSATCDYSMLAHVLHAYRRERAALDVTVVDRCETPLAMCKWYSKLVSQRIDTQETDIFEYQAAAPFDVICTDGFLPRFPPDRKRALMAKWRSLLRPGGKVVTTTRVRSSSSGETTGFTVYQKDALTRHAYELAKRWREFLDLDPREVAQAAQRLADGGRRYSMRSRSEVRELFEREGFVVDRLTFKTLNGSSGLRDAGAGARARRTFARVVASRA
jgi:SAM-dependent methyltransferase